MIKKFESLYKTYSSQLVSEASTDEMKNMIEAGYGDGETGDNEIEGGDELQPQVPDEQDLDQEVEEPKPDLTSEGKRFMIALVLKALSVDPNSITPTDKVIFNQQVTPENAEEVLSKLQNLVDMYS